MKSAKFTPPAATRTSVCPGFSVGSAAFWMASASGPDRLVITKAFMHGSLAGRFSLPLAQRTTHNLAAKNKGGPGLRSNPAELNSASKGPPSRSNRQRVALHHNENGDPNARVKQVEQEILSIDIIDVALIGIGPAHRPDINQLKAVAAILKLRPAFHNHGLCGEGMTVAKVSSELIVRNMCALALWPGLPRLLFLHLLVVLLLIFLLLLFRGLGLVLVSRLYFILFWLSLRFLLARGFVFLGFVVLCIDKRRAP